MFKKILLILVLNFIFILGVNATCDIKEFTIKNVCLDNNCYSTTNNLVSGSDYGYYLSDTNINTIDNFNLWLEEKINIFSSNYSSDKITIKDYCELDNKGNEKCGDKDFGVKDLLYYQSEIKILVDTSWFGKDTYEYFNNGKEYFFENYFNIVNELTGEYPSNYSEIGSEITNYFSGKISLKNVCDNNDCTRTIQKNFLLDSNSSVEYLIGDIQSYNARFLDYFGVDEDSISYSSNGFIAGGKLGFNFSIIDNLSYVADCSQFNYKYKLKYYYDSDPSEELIGLEDQFFTNNDGDLINNIIIDDNGIEQVVNKGVTIEKQSFGTFKANISENITLSKAGKVYFSLEVEDNYGKIVNKEINIGSITIYPRKPYSDNSKIIDKTEGKNLYPEDTVELDFYLYDVFGNNFTDFDKGINISYGNDLLKDKVEFYNGVSRVDKITGIKPEKNGDEYYFKAVVRFKSQGFYEKIFNIESFDRNSYGDYNGFTSNMNVGIYEKGSISKFLVRKVAGSSDFDLVCTNRSLTLRAICTSDNLSGCIPSTGESITISSESMNGRSGVLRIYDFAGNQSSFAYTVDHIDKTGPQIDIEGLDFISKKAFDGEIRVNFEEYPPSGCSTLISYQVYLNGELIKSGSDINKTSTINISDSKLFNISGEKNLRIVAKDFVGNQTIYNKNYTIYPNDISLGNSSLEVESNSDKFGNGNDEYIYTLKLKDRFNNPIFSNSDYKREITGLEQNIIDYSDGKTIFLNNIDGGTDIAFNFDNNSYITDINGEIIFKLKSYAPGVFTQRFSFSINKWGDSYLNTSKVFYTIIVKGTEIENSFKKPILINEINVSNDNGLTWDSLPEIGREQKYSISLNNEGGVDFDDGIVNYSPNNGIGFISEGHSFSGFTDKDTNVNDLEFRFNSYIRTTSDSAVLIAPEVGTDSNLTIEYNVNGDSSKRVKYSLDTSILKGCDKETLGLKIEGTLQGDGKSDITGQETNYSDLSKGEIRSIIRKNAYLLISGMNNGDELNGVKFIDGEDVYLSGTPSYETLIVKDGNVIIDGDLNTGDKKLGIIVLKDNFNTNSDYRLDGNIYVNKDVETINAIIYADGAFRSSDSYGNSYNDAELGNLKLELKGSLFTRNTIGGAVEGSTGRYILPGGEETDSFELAEVYDLNYIRKNMTCGEDYSFLITYNPLIQTNPPIGFGE